ncbi:Rrf2 family transcriptional regulator [uncultured Devosia sp.]|uniref:Rrf2 family transcriptional regulator n=1 Tax=uncultured Devosia sp. TaxID=211434 RepID=UPI0035CA59BC
MKQSARFSVALHALVHLVDQPDAITSTTLAQCLMTNPVVVRRVMGALRAAGIVSSAKGHDGGWRLGRLPSEITLHDVQAALGERLLLRAASDPGDPGCAIVRSVDAVMTDFLIDAEALLAARLKRLTLAGLAGERQAGHVPHANAHGDPDHG